MASLTTMWILIGFYSLLAFMCVFESRPSLAMYWIGAIILNIAVIRMAY